MKKLFKFIRDLFYPCSETKESIMTGGEMFIVLPDMWLCRVNDSSKYYCKIYLKDYCLYDSIACKVAKLVKGGNSDLDYVPEGYKLEILPDVYLLTSLLMETKILSYPMALRRLDEDICEALRISKNWNSEDFFQTPGLELFTLKKISPEDFYRSNTEESIDLFCKLYPEEES